MNSTRGTYGEERDDETRTWKRESEQGNAKMDRIQRDEKNYETETNDREPWRMKKHPDEENGH